MKNCRDNQPELEVLSTPHQGEEDTRKKPWGEDPGKNGSLRSVKCLPPHIQQQQQH